MRSRSLLALILIPALAFSSQCVAVTPEAAIAEFDQRVAAFFQRDSGQPLKRERKRPPLAAGRGNYVRAYSFSMVEFSARCLYLNERLDEANAALMENAQHYLDNPKDINDRDSFHWHADIVMRLIEMYGSAGTKHPGRIKAETEALCLKPIWLYAKQCSWLGKAEREQSKTWHLYSSENHHVMDFTVSWQFSKLAKDMPEYRDLKFDDGATAAEHHEAWNRYILLYCVERSRKGPCVEMMCPGYNSVWLKGFYNVYDFGDPQLRRAAGMLIDLYWAYWSQEQLEGITGGGRSRVRGVKGFSTTKHGIPSLAALYFGLGEQPEFLHGNLNAALSDYRPPAVVADIALNARKSGPYEVIQRAQGLGIQRKTHHTASGIKAPSELRTDGGGIIRYSYCEPGFTIGSVMTEARPWTDWVHISSQARWQGITFARSMEEPTISGRVVPVVIEAKPGRDVLNGHWTVQRKGSLLTQKLAQNKGGGQMVVWLSRAGLSKPINLGKLVIAESETAYVAIRVIGSTFKLADDLVSTRSAEGNTRRAPPGSVVIPDNEYAPVLVEVMSKERFANRDEFIRLVRSCRVSRKGSVVHCQTIYGDTLTLDTEYNSPPTINGQAVDYAPQQVLQSPYLNSDYNSGLVTIETKRHKKQLDFDELLKEQK
jgi:hypothetical protein